MPTPQEQLAEALNHLRVANRIDGSRNSYRKDSPVEYDKVMQYLGGAARPTATSDMGLGLVGVEDARRALGIPPVPPDPEPTPTPGNAYLVSDWSTGKIGYKAGDKTQPWTTIFSYEQPGYQDCGLYGNPPRQASPDGRVSIVPNPYGTGNVQRSEVRQGDPSWPIQAGLWKSEVRTIESCTFKGGNYTPGVEVWVRMEIYLPVEFNFGTGGRNAFTCIAGFHPSSSTGISAMEISNYPGSYLQLQCGINHTRLNLIPLDAAHRNRKLDVVLGVKFAADSSGWVEGWLDGANVVPRQNMQTAAADETGPYWKQGLYTSNDVTLANGKSFLFFGKTLLGSTKADV